MSSWIAHLSLGRKFALLTALAILMAAIPSVRVFHHTYVAQQTLAHEAAGLSPAKALLEAVRVMQEHRGLSATALAGEPEAHTPRQQRADRLEGLWQTALSALDEAGYAQVHEQTEALRKEWTALVGEVTSGSLSAANSTRRHTALISQALLLVDGVLDVSGLALDDEAESYNLVVAAFLDWPRMSEKLGQARAVGSAVLVRGVALSETSERLLALVEEARLHGEDAQRRVEKSGVLQRDGMEELRPVLSRPWPPATRASS